MSRALVLGGTSATGRHVVQNLLMKNCPVMAIVRSKARLEECVPLTAKTRGPFTIKETPSLDGIPQTETDKILSDVDVVMSSLGHTGTFEGIFGHPRRLVTNAVQIIMTAQEKCEWIVVRPTALT